jgi:hypothetical protein
MIEDRGANVLRIGMKFDYAGSTKKNLVQTR